MAAAVVYSYHVSLPPIHAIELVFSPVLLLLLLLRLETPIQSYRQRKFVLFIRNA
jgi:hypothetical protein